ncbi:MAG: ArsR/SmtB family transcription factor [Bacilli bacterium]
MNQMEKSVLIFKCLGDITRLNIVQALAVEAKPVGGIAQELQMTPSAISHQLRILKNNNIVKSERKGKEVYYQLSDHHIHEVVNQVFDHTSHI